MHVGRDYLNVSVEIQRSLEVLLSKEDLLLASQLPLEGPDVRATGPCKRPAWVSQGAPASWYLPRSGVATSRCAVPTSKGGCCEPRTEKGRMSGIRLE